MDGETIDLTPRWQDIVPLYLRLYEDPGVPHAVKDQIKAEFMRLTRAVDQMNEGSKR